MPQIINFTPKELWEASGGKIKVYTGDDDTKIYDYDKHPKLEENKMTTILVENQKRLGKADVLKLVGFPGDPPLPLPEAAQSKSEGVKQKTSGISHGDGKNKAFSLSYAKDVQAANKEKIPVSMIIFLADVFNDYLEGRIEIKPAAKLKSYDKWVEGLMKEE